MARLVCVALVCWPTPFHMYMLTGRLCASSSAVCQTLSAATQWIFSERSGANWRGDFAKTLEDRLAGIFLRRFFL